MNRKTPTVKFQDGSKAPRKDKATYLGTILTDIANNNSEINNRIGDVINTANK